MTPRLKDVYKKEIIPNLKNKFGYKNSIMGPKIEKIVINMGLGLDGNDSKIIKACENDLSLISGQKPQITKFKNFGDIDHVCTTNIDLIREYPLVRQIFEQGTKFRPGLPDFRNLTTTFIDEYLDDMHEQLEKQYCKLFGLENQNFLEKWLDEIYQISSEALNKIRKNQINEEIKEKL